jgi:hypothetical protein
MGIVKSTGPFGALYARDRMSRASNVRDQLQPLAQINQIQDLLFARNMDVFQNTTQQTTCTHTIIAISMMAAGVLSGARI